MTERDPDEKLLNDAADEYAGFRGRIGDREHCGDWCTDSIAAAYREDAH